MFTQVYEPDWYKEEIRRQWQNAASAWHRWQPVIHSWMGEATDRMLDLARIQPGDQVLDIAAGDGGQALLAARRVAPGGRVIATDLSENMLALAARSAEETCITNLETLVMDGERLMFADQSFDAVICRLGLMFFPDVLGSLREIHRVLKPGGRVSMIVFTQPERNAFFSIPLSIIRSRLGLDVPPPGQPGLFRLGDRGVLETYLEQAGFRMVETHILSAPLRLSSAAECVRFERDSFAVLHTLVAALDKASQDEIWREIETAFVQFDGPNGFAAPCEVTVGMGAKNG